MEPTALRVGVHPANLTLFALRRTEFLPAALAEHGVALDVEWVEYEDGRCGADMIATGEVDVTGSGSMPPITAQSEGIDIRYLATSPPRPKQAALVVHADSPYHSLTDLIGARVGLIDGSFHTEVLVHALDAAGHTYRDVTIVDGLQDENADAFDAREIDAWFVSDPFLAQVQRRDDVRALLSAPASVANRSFWFADAEFATRRPEAVDAVVAALRATEAWIADDLDGAAAMLARDVAHGPDLTSWRTSLQRRTWGVLPVDAEVIAEQQRSADLYFAQGILERPVRIAATTTPGRL